MAQGEHEAREYEWAQTFYSKPKWQDWPSRKWEPVMVTQEEYDEMMAQFIEENLA